MVRPARLTNQIPEKAKTPKVSKADSNPYLWLLGNNHKRPINTAIKTTIKIQADFDPVGSVGDPFEDAGVVAASGVCESEISIPGRDFRSGLTEESL